MSEWRKVRAGLYQATDLDGLIHTVERQRGGWWVRRCGTVRTRYETLRAAQQSVRLTPA